MRTLLPSTIQLLRCLPCRRRWCAVIDGQVQSSYTLPEPLSTPQIVQFGAIFALFAGFAPRIGPATALVRDHSDSRGRAEPASPAASRLVVVSEIVIVVVIAGVAVPVSVSGRILQGGGG